jgi:hypothetical protein
MCLFLLQEKKTIGFVTLKNRSFYFVATHERYVWNLLRSAKMV